MRPNARAKERSAPPSSRAPVAPLESVPFVCGPDEAEAGDITADGASSSRAGWRRVYLIHVPPAGKQGAARLTMLRAYGRSLAQQRTRQVRQVREGKERAM